MKLSTRNQLPGTVTCYVDSTIALPLLTAYALTRHAKREHKRYIDKLPMLTQKLRERYEEICKARTE